MDQVEPSHEDNDLGFVGTSLQTSPPVSEYFSNLFREQSRLLDVGCGSGTLLHSTTTGMDLDLHALRLNPVAVLQADVSSPLPFKGEIFDGILAKDIIEHLQTPKDLLVELRRVALHGCKLVIVTPRAVGRAVWADYTHVRGFTKGALTRLLLDSGWQPTRIRRMGGFPLAGRLHLTPFLPQIMSVPGLGHYFGTNWQAIAVRSDR